MSDDLHTVTASDFEPLLNETFLIQFSGETAINSTLVDVSQFNGYSTLERKPFSITFKTHQQVNFPQSIYIVNHPVKGELQIFLVPIGFEGNGMKYEAVFS